MANGNAPPPGGLTADEKIALGGPLNHLTSTEQLAPAETEAATSKDDLSNKQDDFTSSLERKKYIQMRDEEITKAEEHASRIGYKVSSV